MLDKPMVNEYENIYIVQLLSSSVAMITFENISLSQVCDFMNLLHCIILQYKSLTPSGNIPITRD